MKSKLTFLFILCCQFLCAQDLTSVMENYFQALGGKEALEKIVSAKKSYVSIGYWGRGDTTLVEHREKKPHFSHSQSYTGNPKTLTFETYINQQGWIFCFLKPFPIKQYKPAKAKVYIHDGSSLLEAYNEKKLKFSGTAKLKDIGYYAIRMTFKNPEQKLSVRIYYFDKASGLLTASSTEDQKNYTFYSDYRSVDGIYFPFKSEDYLNGEPIACIDYKRIQFNTPMEDASFTPTETLGEPRRDKNSEYNKIEYVNNGIGNGSLDNLIENFKGKRLIIDLWATWCGPCKFEFMKYDTSLYSFLKSYNIEMLFISIDEQKKEEDWITDLKWFNLNGYHLLAGPKLVSSIRKEIYHNNPLYIPRCVLVDEQGKIVFEDLGKPSGDQFRENIKKSFSQ